ncbi:MAG: methyltransferase domain-containing protein [Nanoarchaeota archaeon]
MDYNIIFNSYNSLHEEEQLKKLDLISTFLKVNKSDKLLDIGCGTGISTDFFDCFSVGIDPSFNMLKLSQGNRINSFAENLPFKNNSFDIILALTSIHNFNNIDLAIEEIKRVSKKDSKIVITLLKKSPKFSSIKKKLLKNFNFKTIEEDKDLIFYLV